MVASTVLESYASAVIGRAMKHTLVLSGGQKVQCRLGEIRKTMVNKAETIKLLWY